MCVCVCVCVCFREKKETTGGGGGWGGVAYRGCVANKLTKPGLGKSVEPIALISTDPLPLTCSSLATTRPLSPRPLPPHPTPPQHTHTLGRPPPPPPPPIPVTPTPRGGRNLTPGDVAGGLFGAASKRRPVPFSVRECVAETAVACRAVFTHSHRGRFRPGSAAIVGQSRWYWRVYQSVSSI